MRLILANVRVAGLDLAAQSMTVIRSSSALVRANVLVQMSVSVLEAIKGMIALFRWIVHI